VREDCPLRSPKGEAGLIAICCGSARRPQQAAPRFPKLFHCHSPFFMVNAPFYAAEALQLIDL
jgi:hypothetical protein